jgi:hypothetical protein
MMEGEKMGSHRKGFLKLKCLSPLKMLTSPLFEETLGAFLSHPVSFFFAPSLEDFFSNGFNILAVDTYSRVELCTPTWLNHDYGDGGVVDILAVDTYSELEVWALIFLGETSN